LNTKKNVVGLIVRLLQPYCCVCFGRLVHFYELPVLIFEEPDPHPPFLFSFFFLRKSSCYMGWYHLFILEVFIGQFGSDLEKIKSEPIDFQ